MNGSAPAKWRWYWRRARAMESGEIAAHFRRKFFQFTDSHRQHDWGSLPLETRGSFPELPDRQSAPPPLREAVQRDARSILSGHWTAFGNLPLIVDDPPKWHKDYLAGIDLLSEEPARRLDHRQLPGGADIKLIWELSRWHSLVRLAQAAWLSGDDGTRRKCVLWLDDWQAHNLPFRGWNWTSALESGIRLIQFTWIDALLHERAASGVYESDLERLRYEILPAHAWFTWRNRSFGSSANNHLIGELAGLIVATARWPALEKWSAPLVELKELLEREVLAQFAADGGNREQALNYHLFSFELCWQARAALISAGRPISIAAEERLQRATEFYATVQSETDPWDYGDSDNGFVTPFFASDAIREWRHWMNSPRSSEAIEFWFADEGFRLPSRPRIDAAAHPSHKDGQEGKGRGSWRVFEESGIAIRREGDWFLRWDLSPLGYLSTAAHGHLDALHLSIWFKGIALVVDRGTGAYYADPALRRYLAGWHAHNGPNPPALNWPQRSGPFLWSDHHERPIWQRQQDALTGELRLPVGTVRRTIVALPNGWEVRDEFEPASREAEFAVHWQFAPRIGIEAERERRFRLRISGCSIAVELDPNWSEIELRKPSDSTTLAATALDTACSQVFRCIEHGPFLRLGGRGQSGVSCATRFVC